MKQHLYPSNQKQSQQNISQDQNRSPFGSRKSSSHQVNTSASNRLNNSKLVLDQKHDLNQTCNNGDDSVQSLNLQKNHHNLKKQFSSNKKTNSNNQIVLDQYNKGMNKRLSDYIMMKIVEQNYQSHPSTYANGIRVNEIQQADNNEYYHVFNNQVHQQQTNQPDQNFDDHQSINLLVNTQDRGERQNISQDLEQIDQETELRRVVMKSKIEFYAKEEANEMMKDEQEMRKSISQERSSLIRQKIIQKEHNIITSEINEGRQANCKIIEEFERKYKMQLFSQSLSKKTSEIEQPEDSSKLNLLISNQAYYQGLNSKPTDTKYLSQMVSLTAGEQFATQHSDNLSKHPSQEGNIMSSTDDNQSKNNFDSSLNHAQDFSESQTPDKFKLDSISKSDKFKAIQNRQRQNTGRQAYTQIQSPEYSTRNSLKSSIVFPKESLKKSALQNSQNKKLQIVDNSNPQQQSERKQFDGRSPLQKNNFSKQSQNKDKNLRVTFNETVKENLRNDLIDAVQSYDQQNLDKQNKSKQQEQEKIEDMILSLNRLSQRANGTVPKGTQAQLQTFMNNLEQQKLTYSKKVQNNSIKQSPSAMDISKSISSQRYGQQEANLSQTQRVSQDKYQIQSAKNNSSSTNVNSKILKDIIRHTESKVKQVIINSGQNSNRQSLERKDNYKNQSESQGAQTAYQIFEIENVDESQEQIRDKSIDQLREDLQQLLGNLNARLLSQLFRNRGHQQVNTLEYELGYLFALIVSMVDESIQLNNDKSDLLQKSWEEICKALNNHGRVIYSLQKLRIIIEKPDGLLKQFNKLQILKRFEERKQLFFLSTDSANVILRFISDLIDIFKAILRTHSKHQVHKNQSKDALPNQQSFQSPQISSRFKQINSSSSNFKQSPLKNNNNSLDKSVSPNKTLSKGPFSHNTSLTRLDSLSKNLSSTRKDQPITLQQQLLLQKQHAITKSYQLQLDQSISFRQKSDQAREKELEIQQLKIQQKYILFQLDKQEKLRQEQLEKEREVILIKDQSMFNSYQRLSKQDQLSQERALVRERSVENTEFKRALRQKDLESQLQQHREENQKSMHEYLFNQTIKSQKRNQQTEDCKRKHQELLINKVKQSESYLSQKESDLDERLKSQFEKATYRFKKLDQTENEIKKELETLKKIIQPMRQQK